MGRIVVNKHFDDKSKITSESFVNKGEIIVSNQVGYEGIVIINKNGETFFISPTNGTGSDVPLEYKEYIEAYVNGKLEDYATQKWVIDLISNIEISGGTTDLSNYITKDEISAYTITKEEIRQISAEEVAKIVNDANESYDTLKEISDWILNDTTGAAAMANDINNLKAQLNALTSGAKATASISKGTIYKGESNNVTVTGKMSPSSLEPCNVSIYKGNTLLISADTHTVNYTETVNDTTSYTVKALYNNTTYTATTKVSAYHPTYYGFGETYDMLLENKNLLTSAKRTYSDTAIADGVYYFILVPDGVTKPSSFTMGGAPFNMSLSTDVINGINYTIFKSGSMFNNGGKVNIIAS